jgi:hypothetical protein
MENKDIIKLITKYSILVIISMVLIQISSALIESFFPDELMKLSYLLNDKGLSFICLEYNVIYLINIIFTIMLHKEMKKQNIVSIPILILTFFDYLGGTILFFILLLYKKLNEKTQHE